MKRQLDLFEWADSRPSNVVDAVPALIKRACMEIAYRGAEPRKSRDGRVIYLPPVPASPEIRRTA